MAIDLDLLLRAYAGGYFPMSDARGAPDIFWVEPKRRAILPLDALHISRSLAKTIRQNRFRVTSNIGFERVIAACAEYADDREDTWINAEIEEAFIKLHHLGLAHSIECWADEPGGSELVGGLYGLALGGAFFGESMFSRRTDASKTALVWLVARLRLGGFSLLDCQFMTDHLASLGAVEISQAEYRERLAPALMGLAAQTPCAPVLAVPRSPEPAPAPSPPPSPPVSSGWTALDGLLAAASPGGGASPGGEASLGGGSIASSSPGKLILHSLTHTS